MVDRTLQEPDDVIIDRSGLPIVSAKKRLVRITGSWYAPSHQTVANLPGDGGALAVTNDGGWLVAIEGQGIVGIGGDVDRLRISEILGRPLQCVTALTVLRSGELVVCEGAAGAQAKDWVRDLLAHGRTGRVTLVDLKSGKAKLIGEGLSWPQGVAEDPADGGILVSEAWKHRVVKFKRGRDTWAGPAPFLEHLPAYPCRITPASGGGYWLTFSAVRTQLVEYVLTQRKFRERMIAEIPLEYWIAPSLASTDDPSEPLQIGGIKFGGMKKPWAPPRSYGLVARLDRQGRVVESLHSRHDCKRHGISGARERDGKLFLVSKGHGKLLLHHDETVS